MVGTQILFGLKFAGTQNLCVLNQMCGSLICEYSIVGIFKSIFP